MNDKRKTKAQLLDEIAELRKEVELLESGKGTGLEDAEITEFGSEQHFRSIFERATLGLYRTTPDGQIILANPALVKMLGFSTFEELAERDLNKLGYGAETPRSEFIQHIEASGQITGNESSWVRKDGRIIHVLESATAIRNEKGETVYYDGILEDITLRKESEQELKSSEERYRKLAERINDVIWTTDSNLQITYVSPSIEKMLGYTPDEYAQLPIEERYSEKSYAEVMESFQQGLLDLQSGKIDLENFGLIAEREFISKDGGVVIGEENISLLLDDDNNFVGLQGTTRDITERIKVQEALQMSEERFRTLFDSVPIGLVRSTLDGRILDVNHTFVEMYGYPSVEELLETGAAGMYVDPKDRKRLIDGLEKDGVVSPYQSQHYKYNGEKMWVEGHTRLVHGEGAITFEGAVFDITEQRETERKLKESENRYRAIVENQTEFIVRWSPDGIRTYVNDNYCRYLQLSEHELVGKNFFLSIPEDYKVKLVEVINALTVDNPTTTHEEQVELPDGENRWQQWTDRGIFDDQGVLIEIQSVGRDITKRKKSELEREILFHAAKHRSRLLHTAADVSKSAIELLTPDELLQQTVDLIQRRFRYYYVGIFLVDEARENAVLQAGTGEAGEAMKAAGHKLLVGGESMIGWSIANTQARIALDVGEDAVHFANPYLPETRSEMALPLIVHGEAIGALTVQSVFEAAFAEDDVSVLQTMADQLAIAIQNARLFETTQHEIAERKRAEEHLRMQAAALNAAVSGIIISKSDKEIIWANPAMESLSGYSLDELLGQSPLIFRSGKHDDEFYQEISASLQSDRAWQGIIINKRKDGSFYYEEQTIAPVHDLSGEITHHVAIKQDISDRIHAEQALRISEEKFSTVFNASPNPLAITTFPEGKILEVNESFMKVTGYSQEELVGREDIEIGLWVDIKDRDGLRQQLLDHGSVQDYEFDYQTKEGTIGTTLMSADFIQIGEDSFLLTAFQDITERKRSEEALRISEEKFATVFHASPSAIGLFRFPEGEFVDVNESFCQISGYQPHELIGKTDTDIDLWVDVDERSKLIQQFQEHRVAKDFEVVYRHKEGTIKTALFASEFIQLDQEPLLLTTLQDITDRKQAEAEVERRSQQLAALVQIGQTVASTLELEEILNNVVSVVPPLVNAEEVSVLLLDGEELVFAAVSDISEDSLQGYRMPASEGIAGSVIRNGKPVLLNSENDSDKIYRELEYVTGYHSQSLIAVPLLIDGEVIGVMEGVHTLTYAFTSTDLQMLEAASNWTSIAISNARKHENIQKRFQESQTLAIISQALTETLDLDEVLQLIGRSAREVIASADRTVIHLLDEEKMALWPTVAIGLDELGEPSFNIHVGEGVAGRVVSTGLTINVGDVDNDSRYLPLGEASHLHSLLVAPVQSGRKMLGTISVQSEDLKAFSLDDERLLTVLGFQAAVAIENARLFEAERKRNVELETLRQASLQLTSALELQPVLDTIVNYALKLVDAYDVHIFQYDGEQLTFGAALWAGEHQPEPFSEPRSDGLTYAVARSKQRIVVPDIQKHPLFTGETWEGAIVGLPLSIGDEVRGVMNVAFDEPHIFDENELRILELLADQAAAALETARLFEAEQSARHDAERHASELRQREKHLSYLNDITRVALETPDFGEMMQREAELLGKSVAADGCFIVLWNESQRQTYPGAAYGPLRDEYQTYTSKPGELTLTESVLQMGDTLVVPDTLNSPYTSREIAGKFPTRSALGLPLIAGDQKIGAAIIAFDEFHEFTQDEIIRSEQGAGQIALAIAKALLLDDTQRRADELALLHSIANAGVEAIDEDDLFERVNSIITDVFISDHLELLLVHEQTGDLYYHSSFGTVSEVVIPQGEGISGLVIEKKQPMRVEDVSKESNYYQVHEDTRSELCVPIIVSDQAIGVIDAESLQLDGFSEDDERLLVTIAGQLAIAIEKIRLFVETQKSLNEQTALRKAVGVISSTLELSEVLKLIAEQLCQELNATSTYIVGHDSDSRISTVMAEFISEDACEQEQVSDQGGKFVEEQDTFIALMARGASDMSHFDDRELHEEDRKHMAEFGAKSILYIPLLTKDQLLGFAEIWESRYRKEFTVDEISLAQGIAQQAAIALENARLFDTTRKMADRLMILHQASQDVISAGLDPGSIYTTTHKAAAQLMPSEAYNISILNEAEQEIEGVYLIDRGGRAPAKSIPVDQGLTGHVIKTGHPLRITDINKPEQLKGIEVVHYGDPDQIRALIAVPMRIGEKIVGVISSQSYQPYAYTPDDQLLLELLAANAAIALENARLFDAERSRRQEAEILSDLTAVLTSSLEFEHVLEMILDSLSRVINYHSAAIILIRDDHLEIVAGRGFDIPEIIIHKKLPINLPLFQKVSEIKSPLVIRDVSEDERWEQWEDTTVIRGWMGVPLMKQERVIGFVTLDSRDAGKFSESDAMVVQAIANQAALAIDNARLFEDERQRLAELDTLYRISQEMVAYLDADNILKQATNALWENFGYYHVHIYLLDQQSGSIVVCEGSGSIGEQLKEQGFSLAIGQGIVGHVVANGKTFMTNNVDDVEFFFRNPLLPDTIAELTIPLKSRDGVIGALDIQHQPPNSFDNHDVRLISAVADQLSVALEKAVLYSDLQEALHKEQSTRSQLVQAGKLTALGKIVASVAHELNNPLQAIQNALYLVKLDDTLSGQANEDIQVALVETIRMADLIARLRETYRPKSVEDFHLVSLNALVSDVYKLISTHLRHNHVKYEFIPDDNLPEIFMIGDQVKQIILNLCLNAIESMTDGGKLVIETNVAGDDLLLSVKDSGQGVDTGQLSQIFEPFFTTKEGGSGLGLAIVYDIIQKHDGRIEVDSEIGKGSTFRVYLPKRSS